jgi:hypothetical protein
MSEQSQKAGESSQSARAEISNEVKEMCALLIKLWKTTYPTADASKPEAEPKDTDSEDERQSLYYEFYGDLEPTDAARFQELLEKHTKDADANRYPWIESVKEEERHDWAVEFCRMAIKLGISKDEISKDVYQGHHDELLYWAWEKALDSPTKVEQ